MRVQRSEAGFSIVEVVVAMTIFSVGILSIFQVTDSSFKVATGTTHRARATALATKVVEEVRALPFDKLSNGTTGPWTETVGGSLETIGGRAYLALPATQLVSLTDRSTPRGRPPEATATFRRSVGSVAVAGFAVARETGE